jgi:hypothetical protein
MMPGALARPLLGLLVACASSQARDAPSDDSAALLESLRQGHGARGGMMSLWPKACIYEVPNGATVALQADGTTLVTLGGQLIATDPACPCSSSR